MAMLGSLVTKSIQADRVVAGTPAADVTEKVGTQFSLTELPERVAYLEAKLREFGQHRGIDVEQHFRVVTSQEELQSSGPDVTAFNVAGRTYSKRGTPIERELMRFLLPDAKFVPAPKKE